MAQLRQSAEGNFVSSTQSVLSDIAYVLFTDAPQHVLVSTVQLVCLTLVILLTVFRFVSKRRGLIPQSENGVHSPSRGRGVRIGPLFKITVILVTIASICNLAILVWKIVSAVSHGSQSDSTYGIVYFTSQSLTWIAYTIIVAHEKKFRSVKHAPVLRAWWILNFVLALLLFYTSIAHIVEGVPSSYQAWMEYVLNIVMFLIVVFLLVLGCTGTTGITLEENGALKEPLLPVQIDSTRSLQNEEVTGFDSANAFSKVTFMWMNPLLHRGVLKPLEAKDVPQLAPNDKADKVYGKLMTNYDTQEPPKSLKRALFRAFWPPLAFTGFLLLIKVFMVYVGPLLINKFVDCVAGRETFPLEGLVLVFVLFLAKCVEILSSHHYNFFSNKLGMVIRSSLITTIYRKGLVLSSLGRQAHGTGQIVNYMSVDVQQIADSILQLHNSWAVLVHVAIAVLVLLSAVGVSCLIGIALMLLILSINFTLARVQRNCQGKIMFFRDKRTSAVTEVLNGMKIIKMQAWEDIFQAKVEEVRCLERIWLAKFIYCLAVNIFLLWLIPLSVSAVTFTFCIVFGRKLTPGSVFTTISTFRVLQEPLRLFPQALTAISQSLNSLDRLQRFMWSDELDQNVIERLSQAPFAVQVEGGTFSWSVDRHKPTLLDIEVSVTPGTLVCIVGQVGSGKSTLLEALLGEVPKIAGNVKICGSTAYVAQSAWIQNATIEENIRFGRPMEPAKYKETLRVCALTEDLAQMPYGDQTEIGERGLNLSGGQKQRIQLARAVYQDADIYLLDDVFSAVDAQTGSILFTECIKGALSRKTVLLVTHQVDFLHGADQIWVMRGGQIVQSGNYNDLLQAGLEFGDLVAAHNEAMELVEWEDNFEKNEVLVGVQEVSQSPLSCSDERRLERQMTPKRRLSSKSLSRENSSITKQKARLIEEEEREIGKVSWRVYWLYLTKTMNGAHVIIILLVQTCWQGLQISSDYYLSYATDEGVDRFNPRQFILTYSGLALGSALFVIGRSFLVAYAGLRTSQSFFLTFLRSIFSAPMAFFDTTPTGRILSRFATDQANLDVWIPLLMGIVVAVLFQSLGILFVVIQVVWYMIFIIAPLGWVYVRYQRYFMATSRELTRIDNITRAPVIHHFSETVAGFTTIRAFQQQERFKLENLSRVNANLRMDFHNNAANEWLGFRLEVIGMIVLCTSALFMVTIGKTFVPSNLVGLSLSYGLALNSCLYALVFIGCQLENRMVSVERINQYCRIDSEAPAIIESNRPPQDWPQNGAIEFQNLQIRYRRDTPLVLKGISLTIRGGEKIGVVGRTGSGKSTLILALLRLVEPAGGCIYIDRLDITTIGLRDLRSKFGIIPQDPTLFEGTIRSNIDPAGVHSDDEIWQSLEKCKLADIVRELEGKLDAAVLDNGENFSMGQRQLFCLGRALLNQCRILLLDEATASVDAQTDAIMQKTIRDDFYKSTVISIAHRIATVMDSDRVLVLDSGHVKEFDSPANLLDDTSTLFATLVREYTARSRSYEALDRA